MFRKIKELLHFVRFKLSDGKPLSERLTSRYLLTIRDEANFANKVSFPFTFARVIAMATLTGLLLFSGTFFLASRLLARWFNPAEKQMATNRQLRAMSLAVDSLAVALAQKQLYLRGLGGVIKDDKKVLREDSAVATPRPAAPVTPADLARVTPADAALRAEFEGASSNATLVSNAPRERLQDVLLFPPVRGGLVSERYNAQSAHYGVDLLARKDEPIRCVASGTVLLAAYTDDTGYVMAVQHANNLVSVYKHNANLLKKTGDFVRAGELIAVMGNTGTLTTGPHLHFELWYNGAPVNPEAFLAL